ncbi:MAG: nucleotide exchange factor GrpE [Muribaculaceae bacterium]|nr:nucleotide exchange factor GrpE [Muribaculaceae bacterium]MBQ7854499.1 nucleotide exchange factor GrpE [Muribaculaceae bacterium]
MSKKDEPQVEEIINEEKEVVADIDNENIDNETSVSEENEENLSETDQLKQQLEASKKEYMFLMAEFDNFRKRTIKEKAEIIRNATEKAMKDLLPVVDDFERGLSAMAETTDAAAVKDGMDLIYNKFIKYLEQNGVKAIESTGTDFDTELHEAIAMVPSPDESQKGKVIDTVMKGYTINDKVIRHSKVAVAQ